MRLIIPLLLLLACGCDATSSYFDQFKTGPRALTDEDAFGRLSPDRSGAPEADISSVMMAIDNEIRGGGPMAQDPQVDQLMRRVVFDRQHIDESRFELVDFGEFGLEESVEKSNCAFEAPDEKLMADDYVIPGVEKIPVRSQGGRGTCAAFAGIASIEYAALNQKDGPAASTLPTLDLSEQRFYWMSKPSCQGPTGCECPDCKQGSWYTVGMDASAAGGDFNIPLETDCPYNRTKGDNDTQYPQAESCKIGAVQVEEVDNWCGIDDLIDLLNRGYAVPYASPLSGNWSANDGLITAADLSKPDNSIHSGGHAYLIVGYRKLPDMPEEGGVCFYIKNSWGTGWGVAGYSCQTLEWMRQVTFNGFISRQQPVALKVRVRDDLQRGDALPDNDDTEGDFPDIFDETDPDDDDVLPAPQPDPEPEPEPEPAPEPPVEVFTDARLYGPNETYYEVQTHAEDDDLFIRGEMKQGAGYTEMLRLKLDGDNIIYKGDVIGERRGDVLTVCTREWAPLCALRYRDVDQRLYVQFRDDDLRAVKAEETAEERGTWYSLDLGREYGLFLPNDVTSFDFLLNPKTFVRLGGSVPARVSLQRVSGGTDFMVRLSGQEIGVFKPTAPTQSALCSGPDYGERCELRGLDRTFVLPRNTGTRVKRAEEVER
ncbi:MAG: C1 family peptidase [Bradymonadia bacterium]